MNTEYKIIDFDYGCNIESAVNKLLFYKNKGMLASGVFNGVTLYSDTVTLDNAYISITGNTKSENDKRQQEWMDNRKKAEREHQEQIPDLTCLWMKKGREILTSDKWKYWDEIVPIRLNDLYHGMELGCCLKIVKILNDGGTLVDAKKEIESQEHSGMSFGLVRTMVREFCDRGQEFVDYVR